jgi:hypothetical protein
MGLIDFFFFVNIVSGFSRGAIELRVWRRLEGWEVVFRKRGRLLWGMNTEFYICVFMTIR